MLLALTLILEFLFYLTLNVFVKVKIFHKCLLIDDFEILVDLMPHYFD